MYDFYGMLSRFELFRQSFQHVLDTFSGTVHNFFLHLYNTAIYSRLMNLKTKLSFCHVFIDPPFNSPLVKADLYPHLMLNTEGRHE